MSYVEGSLVPGERILYRTHLHWINFLPAGIVSLLFIIMAIAIVTYDQKYEVSAIVLFLLGLLPVAGIYVRSRCSEFAVTDKRVLIKTGILKRHTLETLLNKVENIGVEQGFMGRVLDYGTIRVTGTGSTKEIFENIAAPLEFRKQVQAATLNYEARKNTVLVDSSAATTEREERDCPFCAERILAKAKICRFCGRDVTGVRTT